MKKVPHVSVIIPNFNHAQFLEQRIDSVLNQSYRDFEVIILDDLSTDNSREIINRYKNNPQISKIVFNTENSGSPFLQWNKGIELSEGKLIWIAESDDVANTDFLLTLVSELDAHPDAVIAFSHSFLIDSNNKILKQNLHSINDGTVIVHSGKAFAHGAMLNRNDIYNASMVVFRKSSYYLVDNSFIQYRFCGDWLFWMNICIQGEVIEVCRQLNSFRQHLNKVTTKAGKTGKDWKEVASVLRHFITLLSLKGLELRVFRGKWTADFMKSHYLENKELVDLYPDVFGASFGDLFLYKMIKILRKFDSCLFKSCC